MSGHSEGNTVTHSLCGVMQIELQENNKGQWSAEESSSVSYQGFAWWSYLIQNCCVKLKGTRTQVDWCHTICAACNTPAVNLCHVWVETSCVHYVWNHKHQEVHVILQLKRTIYVHGCSGYRSSEPIGKCIKHEITTSSWLAYLSTKLVSRGN